MPLNEEQKQKLRKSKKRLTGQTRKDFEYVGGLFPRGFLSFFASPPGVGKTWLTLFFATKGANGKTITGEVTNRFRTVIMVGETGTDLLDRRIAQTNWTYEEDYIAMYSSFDLAMANMKTDLTTEEGRAVLTQIILEDAPDIIFFDTLIAFHSMDESKQAEMTRLYTYLARVAHNFNIAICCNHHTRKRTQSAPTRTLTQDDLIGTSAGIRLASSVYIIDVDPDTEKTLVFRNVKSWDEKIPDISLTFITDDDDKLSFSVKTQNRTEKQLYRRILNSIILYGSQGSLFRPKELALKFGFLERSVRRVLKKFAEADDDGIKVLKEISIDGEIMYAGNLTDGQLNKWVEDNNFVRPFETRREEYMPDSVFGNLNQLNLG